MAEQQELQHEWPDGKDNPWEAQRRRPRITVKRTTRRNKRTLGQQTDVPSNPRSIKPWTPPEQHTRPIGEKDGKLIYREFDSKGNVTKGNR